MLVNHSSMFSAIKSEEYHALFNLWSNVTHSLE